MKLRTLGLAALLSLAAASPVSPQQGEISIEDALQMGADFLQENLDEDLLDALNQLDSKPAAAFIKSLTQQLQSEYVIDLAELRKTANTVIPLLDAYEETAPYAAWLKARLDYLQAAEEFKRIIPPPKPVPGQPPPKRPNPTPEQELKVWRSIVAERPVPKAAAPYVKALKPVFAAQGVPAQLVWVAEVESGFNPRARSPVGAAGLYQLMPATAKSLGLSARLPDQRLDPEKCARAAARYLKYLHGRFKDWKLALAAYNAGEGRVMRLLEKQRVKTFEAISPKLPAETQMYVPKIEATLLKREGISFARLPAPTK
jgi:membrane-bound lytic murein transglycosylase D